jgi:hypothetical protein
MGRNMVGQNIILWEPILVLPKPSLMKIHCHWNFFNLKIF